MYTFRTQSDGFRQIRRKMIFRDIPLILLGLTLLTLLSEFGRPESSVNWYIPAAFVLFFAIIIAFSFPQIIIKQKHIYEEFLLRIDENEITREQYYSDDLTIAKDEVSKIYKISNGGIVIEGVPGSDPIIIPRQMEDSEKLEQVLSGIRSFSPMPFLEKYKFWTMFIGLSLFAAFYFFTSKWSVVIIGSIILVIYGFSIYKTYRHKRINDIPKMNIFLGLNLLYIIGHKMYLAFMGG